MFVNGINLHSYKSLPRFLNKKPQGAILSLLDGVLVHRMLSLPLLPPPPPPLKKKCNNWASITIHKQIAQWSDNRLQMTSLGFPVTSLILSYSPYEERQCESYVSYPRTQHNE